MGRPGMPAGMYGGPPSGSPAAAYAGGPAGGYGGGPGGYGGAPGGYGGGYGGGMGGGPRPTKAQVRSATARSRAGNDVYSTAAPRQAAATHCQRLARLCAPPAMQHGGRHPAPSLLPAPAAPPPKKIKTRGPHLPG